MDNKSRNYWAIRQQGDYTEKKKRKRNLLERLGAGNTRAANPDIGTVPKMFPWHD